MDSRRWTILGLKMFKIIFLLFIFSFSSLLFARPEYANREKVSCLSCHVNPFGGGHRKISGKIFGSKEHEASKYSDNDNYYADFRGIFKRIEGDNSQQSMSNGMSVMTAEVSVKADTHESETGFSSKLVASYDLSSISPGVRSTYFLFYNSEEQKIVDTILIGKSYLPFGLLTDEHRTYTKLQTMTRFNRDFEMGVTASGYLSDDVHYDLSYFNGYQSTSLTSNDETHGSNININWNPMELPFFIGASHIFHYSQKRTNGPSPYASSLYLVFDFKELNESLPAVTILSEYVLAKHFNTSNNSNRSKFVNAASHPNYLLAIEDKESQGILALVKWDLTSNWQLSYKYDQLLLAKDFEGDRYNRHGLGLRYQFSSNSSLSSVVEKVDAKKPGINSSGNLWADTDNFILMFRTWL